MLSLSNRITKNKDFEEVHKKGDFFSFGIVFLKIKKNNLGYTRFGISIGLKFSKKATERNKIKRKLRLILDQKFPSVKKGFDIVIGIKKRDGLPDNQELMRDIEKSLKLGRVIN
ncbi:MAG: ribonuclease P protein component [Candidatus Moranbacteria bacterium CG_4_8_14_3_um_filter_34_16]|nr:MAG: ribonuclease P protein component [Candidatus Moranbacteria bacterium CG08_land_8_20_14_0_20_34_16]PIW94728.1 MAG: ribonuclease P protein component [Candidatus Moranbacteria bacterium CG_4_8_14_3_um_filter_34_16]